jgi:hypothetical protein
MDNTLAAAVLGAAVGFVTTYLGAVVKLRTDLRFQYDKDLREKRIKEYSELWRLTGLFPKYAREAPVTLTEVRELTHKLRDWYFTQGGMYLSDEGREAYFQFQEVITTVLANAKQDSTAPLEGPTYESLRTSGSNLRSALVRDVATRKHSEISRES